MFSGTRCVCHRTGKLQKRESQKNAGKVRRSHSLTSPHQMNERLKWRLELGDWQSASQWQKRNFIKQFMIWQIFGASFAKTLNKSKYYCTRTGKLLTGWWAGLLFRIKPMLIFENVQSVPNSIDSEKGYFERGHLFQRLRIDDKQKSAKLDDNR